MLKPNESAVSLVLWVAGASLLLAVAIAWGYVFRRLLRRKRLLPQWPRRPVPWTFPLVVATGVMTFGLRFLMVSVVQVAEMAHQGKLPTDLTSGNLLRILLADTLGSILGGGAAVLLLVFAARARAVDLGWNPRWWKLDVRLGLLAFLLAVVPVYVVHLSVQYFLQNDQGHPLLEALSQNRDPAFLAALFFSAAVVAPVLEELLFRVVLQGWLERALGCFGREEPMGAAPLAAEGPLPEPSEVPLALPAQEDSAPPLQTGSASCPPWRCWVPILATALLFGLVHWGHGAAPVALSLFGLVLGYLYQRTGRLLPVVVLHATFNLFGLATALALGPSW